ncbi:MAG: aromatic-ring-hydroxylating dioxygenase subunit beta [Pigmentiphaga sp.]|uniref:aromatic-ring-hydroxylating dioxygenase subunit beta n=1 Tax=Pigmentiphaga sp. TaxID=1977564 RepID=UPI0029AE9788|nr:aromatic-ring-hydroxylating dioxygenase subunit beta [Pigmentiphaga sp.]MDX3906694.1 aromatic-ring-hydroxylating dioxygenase subunit beta [Pigmentiphaga sp.]
MNVTQQEICDRVYLDYADAIDNGSLETWPDFFTSTAVYRIVSKENYDRNLPLNLMYCDGMGMLKDRAHASASLNVYAPRTWRHLVSNIRIRQKETLFTGCANFAVFETIEGKSTHVLASGRYLDLIVCGEDGIRLARRTVVYDTGLIPGSVVFPL